jgi:hypothetical protein
VTAGFGEQVAAVEAAVLVHDEHGGGDGDGRQADIAPTTAAGGLTGADLARGELQMPSSPVAVTYSCSRSVRRPNSPLSHGLRLLTGS